MKKKKVQKVERQLIFGFTLIVVALVLAACSPLFNPPIVGGLLGALPLVSGITILLSAARRVDTRRR